jgi:redox-sensitive bicupin YhaK (pirin superfamily)
MQTTDTELIARGVDRIFSKRMLGPDAQSDAKAMLISPDNFAATDPFLVLVEDWFSAAGFDWHPHRGIETVTLVLDGVLEHGDSLGNAGALESGDVQWMTAGRGIIHRELAFRNEHAHTLQLWVNLPADKKLVETRYQDLRAASRLAHAEPGVIVRAISGQAGQAAGQAANHHPILGLLVTLDPGATYAQLLPADSRAFAHVLQRSVFIAGKGVHAGQTAWSDPVGGNPGPSSWLLQAADGDEQTRLMLYAGRPLGEPVVAGGPFVMNRHEEITQAYADYRSGKFGQVPRTARLRER